MHLTRRPRISQPAPINSLSNSPFILLRFRRPNLVRSPQLLTLDPPKHRNQERAKRNEPTNDRSTDPVSLHVAELEVEFSALEVHVVAEVGHACAVVGPSRELLDRMSMWNGKDLECTYHENNKGN